MSPLVVAVDGAELGAMFIGALVLFPELACNPSPVLVLVVLIAGAAPELPTERVDPVAMDPERESVVPVVVLVLPMDNVGSVVAAEVRLFVELVHESAELTAITCRNAAPSSYSSTLAEESKYKSPFVVVVDGAACGYRFSGLLVELPVSCAAKPVPLWLAFSTVPLLEEDALIAVPVVEVAEKAAPAPICVAAKIARTALLAYTVCPVVKVFVQSKQGTLWKEDPSLNSTYDWPES